MTSPEAESTDPSKSNNDNNREIVLRSHSDSTINPNPTLHTPTETQQQSRLYGTFFFWNSLTTHIEERTELSIEQASAETPQLQPPESQPEQVANESPQELEITNNQQQLDGTTTWWNFSSYSMISYFKTTQNTPDEETPLLMPPSTSQTTSTKEDSDQTVTQTSSWWNWVFGSTTPADNSEDDEDESHTSNLELYKRAKQAIETSKEEIHYVFKKSISLDTDISNKVGLSVYGTLTEETPVEYNCSKRKNPLSPNEILENLTTTKEFNNSSNKNIGVSLNLTIIPCFDDNYRDITTMTKLRILLKTYIVCDGLTDTINVPSENHLYKQTPKHVLYLKRKKIKKITIIGVHSFLPNKLVRSLMGNRSSGNSNTFVETATQSVLSWLKENDNEFDLNDYDIETLSVEGQGKVNERVEKSYQLITKNWIQTLESSQFIFFVSHGIGSIIAINLLSKLLTEHDSGITSRNKYLGMLCMNGGFLGPFKGLNSRLIIRAFTPIENEIINELFQYQNTKSKLSIQLNNAMDNLIENNVKIVFSGVINDPFIPLYSLLAIQFSHPNITRNIYYNDNNNNIYNISNCEVIPFVSQLLKIICLMKNLGYDQDYDLVRDLSDKFESLTSTAMGYSISGASTNTTTTFTGFENSTETTNNTTTKYNSTIFNDDKLYLEAIRFSLETTNLIGKQRELVITDYNTMESIPSDGDFNFYNMLPWNMRSLLHDFIQIKHVKSYQLIEQLINQFNNEWDPSSKTWKDIKYCLGGLEDFHVDELI